MELFFKSSSTTTFTCDELDLYTCTSLFYFLLFFLLWLRGAKNNKKKRRKLKTFICLERRKFVLYGHSIPSLHNARISRWVWTRHLCLSLPQSDFNEFLVLPLYSYVFANYLKSQFWLELRNNEFKIKSIDTTTHTQKCNSS